MKIALVGFELEGRAAYEYWSKLDAQITVCDQDIGKQVPDGADKQLGPDYLKNLDRFDIVWRTAGINPAIILRENPNIASKITSTMNEFLRVCPTKHVIGVTGTKGKGTTTTLITKMLEVAGKEVYLGGNIGLSPFEFLPELTEGSYVVLELSSFQLADLQRSPSLAVCLMVMPEHLDWHADLDDYILAKARLFEHQAPSDTAIYFAKNDDSRKIACYSPGLKIPYFAEPGAHVENDTIVISGQHICATGELKLLGKHNWQNVCAAVTTVWQITQNTEAMRRVLTNFSGLEHRLEFVRKLDGIRYYNDSFASGPDSAIAAIEAIPGPKVMIMGGFERNLPLAGLAHAVQVHAQDIRKVVVIGASGPRLARELDKAGFTDYMLESAKTMQEIVTAAKSQARPGDAVLLSPGFASFDMFKNFEERGLRFKAAVSEL